MSVESDKGLLIDLSHPVSPKKAPTLNVADDDDEFLATIPNLCSNQVFVGINDVSYSLEKRRKSSQNYAEKDRNSSSECKSVESPPLLLDEEQFDFDVPNWAITSDNESEHNSTAEKSEDDNDDEVFFGPVGHTEKCVAVGVSEVAKVHEKQRPLSPLTAAEMAELCREACTVASRIEIAAGIGCSTSAKDKDDKVDKLSRTEVELPKDSIDRLAESIVATGPSSVLQSDENGVVQFSATGQRLPKIAKPAVRQIGSGMVRPASIKNMGSLNVANNVKPAVQNDTSNTINTLESESCVIETVGLKHREAISVKRQCISTTRDEGEISDSASVASDTSESSCVNQATGKRSLPQPKFVRSAVASKLPQVGARSVSTEDKCQSQASSHGSSTGDETSLPSTVTTPSLQRSTSSLRQPVPDSKLMKLPRPLSRSSTLAGSSTAGTSSTAEVSEKVSGLRAPVGKTDLVVPSGSTVPGSDKRKTLTAIRSLTLVGAGQRQGPLKAVIPSSGSIPNSATAAPAAVPSTLKGIHLPAATSTPRKPLQSDGRLNSSLCTPSRSCVKPPVVTGSTQKRLSCVGTPVRLNSSFSMSRNEYETSLHRRPSIDSARKPAVFPQTPVSKENVSSLKQTNTLGAQLKSRESQIGVLGARRTALKSSNN